jgi:hypothetical protein
LNLGGEAEGAGINSEDENLVGLEALGSVNRRSLDLEVARKPHLLDYIQSEAVASEHEDTTAWGALRDLIENLLD